MFFVQHLLRLCTQLGLGVQVLRQPRPAADRVRGQTVMMVASNGLGGMMGGVLAGWTLDLGGANLMLAACIASGCLGVLFCLAALRLSRGKRNQLV